ncbi:MAG: sigma 54-interacting transcriptional regulator [Gemmatimonadota bacterium]
MTQTIQAHQHAAAAAHTSLCALCQTIQQRHGACADGAMESVLAKALDMILGIAGTGTGVILLKAAGGFEVVAARNADDSAVAEARMLCRRLNGSGHGSGDGVGLEGGPLCLPLRDGERVVGALYLGEPDQRLVLPRSAPDYYDALAGQLATLVNGLCAAAAAPADPRGEGRDRFAALLGESPAMHCMLQLLSKVVESPSPVLIIGESGTGKELVARAIHYEGPRRKERFVAENCAALPETLLESELFGYVKGAFTGAVHDKEGLFEVAHGGTLFLDEIADTSPAVQAKLLRVLEAREIRRLGDTVSRPVDARVVAATSRDLMAEVEAGRFRPELYYRLGVLTVSLPPLRQRAQDIPLLATHFLTHYADHTGKALPGFAPEVLEAFRRYTWPGNVRELRNEVERVAALADAGRTITADLMSERLRAQPPRVEGLGPGESLPAALERIKREMIVKALESCGGNRTRAARQLGLSRPNLQKTMKRLGIDVPSR